VERQKSRLRWRMMGSSVERDMSQQSNTYMRGSPLQGEANYCLDLKEYSTKTCAKSTPTIDSNYQLKVSA
jgi:hypothetical protein